MAPEAIHVDAGDEVPVIIERIRRSPSDEVHLVLPPRARLGQSRFNFQLLKQYSTRLGKRVAIWSPEPAVQRLAEESGFGTLRPEQAVPTGSNGQVGRPVPPAASALPRLPTEHEAAGGPAPAVAPGQPPSRLGGIASITRPGPLAPARIRIGAPRRLPSRISQYDAARYALYAGAVLVLLAGIVAVLFYVPSATVTLVARAQPFSTQVDVTAEPSKGTVRVRAVNLPPASLTLAHVPATGTKSIGGQLASGRFTYVNNCGFGLQIPNGQRLLSAAGMAFYQVGDVQVQHNEQKTVDIKATQAGTAGNVEKGQITGIENNAYNCLTGTNQEATGGGTDDQKQTVIQSSDIATAKARLEQQLRTQMLDDLKKGARPGETLASQPIFTNEQFGTDHNVDENYSAFTATLTLNVEGDYYFADDVARVFAGRLESKVPKDQQLTTNRVVPSYTVTASSGGHLDFSGSASGYVAPRIDIARIKSELAGKPAGQAHDVLGRLPVQHSTISQSPPLPLLPLSASRIYIDYGVDSGSSPSSP